MSRGFGLVAALMLVLLMSLMVILIQVRIADQWRLALDVESQLHSLVLAENGLEYARTLLPHLEINSLLSGLDGTGCGEDGLEWRNPLPFAEALRLSATIRTPECDDGLPFEGDELLPHPGRGGQEKGVFLLRFSNNPEEAGAEDGDGVVVVRSMGLAPVPLISPSLPEIRNAVTLIESRLRQERTFLLPSPLTLFADAGSFEWQGQQFSLEGNDCFAITPISPSGSSLREDLTGSWNAEQRQRIRGRGERPSIAETNPLVLKQYPYAPLEQPEFWNHFLQQLPDFADGTSAGLAFYPRGGRLETSFSGFLVAMGDFSLAGEARLEGLLLHLGAGRLTLSGGTQIEGAVWMSSLDTSGETLRLNPVGLTVSGTASIRYHRTAILRALGALPPTQLGWRILYPETLK